MKTVTINKSEKQPIKTFKDFSKSPVIQKKIERANAIIAQIENLKA